MRMTHHQTSGFQSCPNQQSLPTFQNRMVPHSNFFWHPIWKTTINLAHIWTSLPFWNDGRVDKYYIILFLPAFWTRLLDRAPSRYKFSFSAVSWVVCYCISVIWKGNFFFYTNKIREWISEESSRVIRMYFIGRKKKFPFPFSGHPIEDDTNQ